MQGGFLSTGWLDGSRNQAACFLYFAKSAPSPTRNRHRISPYGRTINNDCQGLQDNSIRHYLPQFTVIMKSFFSFFYKGQNESI